ncbi:Multidrug efflux pump subunit AcrB [Parapedobacter composti]|uniref:Multidrug efflux pump subunit AcrB n=1 Tax=Parapedobacter composti TaxID=623281 RepID=A0A1I1HGD2_9SPHI|nr:efflux RND transporter permease subunit [Parapedobacter composti]SFC23024.1 Multidrug efflux pump subunit AcrB [Parapedobacter composti]
MDLIRYPIRNYQFTLIVVLMIVAVGVSSILTMPRAEDPEMQPPNFPVVVVYPGTTPKDMEQLVVKPLESRLYDLDNMKRIRTTIVNGLAVLFVEYEHGTNYDNKYQELIREVSAMRPNLPEDIYSIDVQQIDPTGVNVLQVALVSENASRKVMKDVADKLKEELEKVRALKEVKVSGLSDQLVRVDVEPARLAQLGIPLNRVVQAIQSEGANIPGGSVHAGDKVFSIKTSGNYQSVEDIRNTIVSSTGGKNIHLRDIADVYTDFAPETHITRLNGYRAVFVNAAQKAGENISRTQEAYLQVLDRFEQQLPENIALILHFDQGENVNKRLSGLGVDFLIAVTLVLITLLPLGIRASLVVMIAVPLSLAMGIITLNMFGYSLNQLSIVGFVVALGLVVDDSIVVVENIERWMRNGFSRVEAAIRGTHQIALAVVGCTVTLAIAFMPLMFMPEVAGDFIRSLPMAVIGSVMASMLVALLVVPFLSSRLLKPHEHPDGNAVLRWLQRTIHSTYAVLLDKALRRPRQTVAIALVIFLGALALIPVIGFSLFPASEKPQFLVRINAPLQAHIYTTDSIARRIERELAELPQVQYVASNVGKGNPRVYYNVEQANERADFAELFVQLQPDTSPKEKEALIEQLRQRWTPYLGAKVEVKNFEQGVPVISPVEVRLFGENLDTLKQLAARVEAMMEHTRGALYVNNPVRNDKTDIQVEIDREKALALGVPTANIDRTVRLVLAGVDATTYTDPATDDDDYLVRVSVPRAAYPDLSVFEQVYVDNAAGQGIPFSQLAVLKLVPSPSAIYHINKERTVSVNCFVDAGYTNSAVINDVIRQMDDMPLPAGYRYEMGGEVESTEQSFGGFGTVILITVFLFIAVLVLEFKTLKSTLIVLSVIPLGIVGAVLALLVTGNTLSFVATVGLVALAGIEVKNTILLVDFTNQLRREGVPLNEAIEKAGEMRFLPIILTSLTAIGGLLPIAWSSNPLISPLAVVMIGGLISSTLLSRVVTPVVYKLMPPRI